jgi:hypothetical protein
MDRFEASLLPLITIADYLWDSESYDADQSWNRALEELVPVEIDRNALRHLFRNCFESCLAVDAAPEFGGVLGGATLAWRTGHSDKAAELFESYSNAVAKNYQIIGSKTGNTFTMGSAVRVKIKDIDLRKRTIDLVLVEK